MKNLTWQNPEQLFVAQVLINKVKSKCCGIKVQKNIINAGLYIPDNKEIYNTFLEKKDEIEKALDSTVEWRKAKKASRFLISKNIDINDSANWNEACYWLMDTCIKIKGITENLNK